MGASTSGPESSEGAKNHGGGLTGRAILSGEGAGAAGSRAKRAFGEGNAFFVDAFEEGGIGAAIVGALAGLNALGILAGAVGAG